MNRIIFPALIGIIFTSCSIANSDKNRLLNEGNYSCKNNFGGNTKIFSKDSIILGLIMNQLWVQVKATHRDSNEYLLHFVEVNDAGSIRTNFNWNKLSKERPLGSIKIINDTLLIKEFYGLFDSETDKEISDLALDWNICDTIVLR